MTCKDQQPGIEGSLIENYTWRVVFKGWLPKVARCTEWAVTGVRPDRQS